MDDVRRTRLIGWLGLLALAATSVWLPLRSAEAAPTVSRISGVDRYETAAEISEASFAPGVGAAYLATGDNFPDALAGGPAAAKAGGPVLLTSAGALPPSTATELDRLDPGKIVVLGGTSAVSDAVKNGLQQYTAGTVTRIEGANRFETAANLSAATFTAPVDTAYVATGLNFPDALSGGPAAANALGGGAPILLVEPNAIPAATATELQRLGAQRVVILGGTSAVSDAVGMQLEAYSVDPVSRRFGADRYLTSVDISTFHFGSASKVYLATGANFPDALAGGPPAGIAKGPVLLTQQTCIPPEVNDEIDRLDPGQLIVLGGEAAVATTVLNRIECQPPTTTTTGTTLPTVPGNAGVTPGAFCSPAGAPGVSSGGVPMTCQVISCEGVPYDQARWRKTTC